MKSLLIATASVVALSAGLAQAYDNPEAAYPYNHSTVTETEQYTAVAPAYGEPTSPSEARGYSVKADKQLWETESRQGKSGSDGSVDAYSRTNPGAVKAFRSGPDTNR